MRAIRVERPGGAEALVATEVDGPTPGTGEVLVAVEAAGVNFIDVYHRSGRYPLPMPTGIGVEGAGTVIGLGPDVTAPALGTRVAWLGVQGSYAERVVVPADRAVIVPEAVTTELAAAVLLQGLTAHALTHDTRALGPGDTVLVWAAAGGAGRLVVQLASARGARVLACVSTEAKAEEVRRLGADAVRVTGDGVDVAAWVRGETEGRGVEVVYDSVGAASITASLDACARLGLVVSYGQSSGPVPPIDVLELSRRGSLFLTRPTVFDHLVTPEALASRAAAVLGAVAEGTLDVRVHDRLPLDAAAAAHRALESRATSGKLLLLP
ncbi:MAG: hypothetical protein RLZZ272_1070 [Actinomycetota bacterium]